MESSQDWFGADAATFGDRVAAAREAAGMTQKQLAKRLGVRVATLRAWEDDLSEPRANRLSIMAGLLNVSMMWIINGEGEGLSGPVDVSGSLSDDMRNMLTELRDLRADMLARAEQVARLEKRLRAMFEPDVHHD